MPSQQVLLIHIRKWEIISGSLFMCLWSPMFHSECDRDFFKVCTHTCCLELRCNWTQTCCRYSGNFHCMLELSFLHCYVTLNGILGNVRNIINLPRRRRWNRNSRPMFSFTQFNNWSLGVESAVQLCSSTLLCENLCYWCIRLHYVDQKHLPRKKSHWSKWKKLQWFSLRPIITAHFQ